MRLILKIEHKKSRTAVSKSLRVKDTSEEIVWDLRDALQEIIQATAEATGEDPLRIMSEHGFQFVARVIAGGKPV